jgi:hypothetical protein
MPMLIAQAKAHVEYKGKRIPQPEPEILRGHRYHDPVLRDMARIAHETGSFMALTYLPTAIWEAMLATITGNGLFMSLHSASPGQTGASEILGTTEPTYSTGGYTGARMPISWASPNVGAGSVTSGGANGTQTFPMTSSWVQAGIPYFGIWTLANSGGGAGTYNTGGTTSGLTSVPPSANVVFTSSVTLTIAG